MTFDQQVPQESVPLAMPSPFAAADYAVLGACLVGLIGIAAWAGRGQRVSDQFLLADHAGRWWWLGPSLGLGGVAALVYCAAPVDAYTAGARYLLPAVLVWAAFPVVVWLAVPLYARLEVDSIYEYLELRYGPRTRAIAAGAYVVWQVLLLGGLLALPAKALGLGGPGGAPAQPLILAVGAAATLGVFLSGMKGTVRTNAVQLALLAAVAVAIVALVATSLGAGPARIWEVAGRLGRTQIVDGTFDLKSTWSAWVAIPALALLAVFFFLADQATLQRFLAARTELDMKLAFLSGTAAASAAMVTVMFLGLGLLAVYQDRPQTELPPYWVANLAEDPRTGRPLLGPDAVIDGQTIEQLAAEGLILDPNTNRPFESNDGLVNARGELSIDRLATRGVGRGEIRLGAAGHQRVVRLGRGEYLIRRGQDRLLAQFAERHLGAGLAGLVLAALAAVAMGAVEAGLSALCTVLVVDFHERFGWAESWLARRCGKPASELDQADEMRLARPAVLALGAAVVLVGAGVSALPDVVRFLLSVVGVFAGPMLAVFLLGIFTRRATAAAALSGLALGAAAALVAALGHLAGQLWPMPGPLGAFWPFLIGLAVALVVGYALSFVVGRKKTRDELTGLVVGVGRLGEVPEPKPGGQDVLWLPSDDEQDDQAESPWAFPV